MSRYAETVKFDTKAAGEAAESFAVTSGVCCSLYDESGKLLLERSGGGTGCAFCRRIQELTGRDFKCGATHRQGAALSERFGGRYIYFCPVGMSFFASPVMSGGSLAGALIGGPVLIMDMDEFMASDVMQSVEQGTGSFEEIKTLLDGVHRTSPRRLEHLSDQLFASAVYVSDSSHELFLLRDKAEQQNAISDYIISVKDSEERLHYPSAKEHELFEAVSHGDRTSALKLLNEMLGHIFFYNSNAAEIRTRITELFVVLSRAAISGGANTEQVLRLNHRYIQDMRSLKTQAELTRWLASSLSRFTNLVFEILDVKHTDTIQKAQDYMSANYTRKLSLDEVAGHVGYSPTYFSRIFKEEMGITFKEALNQLRIEKSKALLFSGSTGISEICTMVGFNDQSYYCKMFKRVTGVTPDKFRKRSRRIDSEKEYGLK